MTGKTHMIGGTMAALGIITATKGNMNYWDMATCLCCCELGSLIPDIDTTSKITESDVAFKAVSLGLQSMGVKHRGPTHTIWASLLFGVLFGLIAQLMVGLANSSAAFMIACVVFFIIHTDNDAYAVRKFGSIIAIGVYFGLPIAMQFLPADIMSKIPTVPVRISGLMVGMSVFWGCISHLAYDTCNIQGIQWLHPLSQKRFHILPITTSSGAETIFAGVATVITLIWAYLLYQVGYIRLPF